MSAATESGIRLSGHTLDKATKAKVTLENYYSNLIAQHIERKQRYDIDVFSIFFFVICVYNVTTILVAIRVRMIYSVIG